MSRNSAYLIIISVLCLVALGLVMLLSVSAFARDNQGNAMFFITRQAIWLTLGLVACVVASRVDYHLWVKYAWILTGVSFLLVLACFIPGLGRAIKGAHRWIILGPFNVQPSEICKLATVVFLAFWFGEKPSRVHQLKGITIPLGVIMLLIGVLLLQPDLGTCVMVLSITFLLLFVAGARLLYILPLPFLGFIGILTLAFFMPERRSRLMAFMDPNAHRADGGYQVWQALVAFGSGGVKGVGLGDSVQKMYYLPEAHTDFIFPIIGEELGLICTLLVVFGFLLIALAGGYISYHAPDMTGLLLGIGSVTMLCLQAGMNIAVVTSLIPAKGVGLPFMSYGGSNLVLCLLCIGILLNLHRQADYGPERVDLLGMQES